MNYYPHHIGDFIKSTANLTHEERSIYLQLIWKYYDTEKPLPDDAEALAFDVGARDRVDLIGFLLKRYFEYDNALKSYTHKRIDAEIAKYQAKAKRANAANNARHSKTALKSEPIREQLQNNISSQPITNNQEPITKINNTPSQGNSIKIPITLDWQPEHTELMAIADNLGVKAIELSNIIPAFAAHYAGTSHAAPLAKFQKWCAKELEYQIQQRKRG